MSNTKISAGSYDLNKFLHGGFERDIITTIYGPGASGKSNICMILIVSQTKKGNKVLLMDTEGGFSIDRYKQIHSGKKEEIEKNLQNLFILKPTSFKEQESDFEKLLKLTEKNEFSAIIVDSIAMLYRLELGLAIDSKDEKKIHEVNRKLAYQLRSLNEIARKKNIPVILTNQVYSSFAEDSKINERQISMVGGDLLKYWSKCLIELQNKSGKRKMILKKHRSLPVKSVHFEIVDSGIRKKGIF